MSGKKGKSGIYVRTEEYKNKLRKAHHIKPLLKIIEEYNIINFNQAINCVELWDIDNGITLCRTCHYLTRKKICLKF